MSSCECVSVSLCRCCVSLCGAAVGLFSQQAAVSRASLLVDTLECERLTFLPDWHGLVWLGSARFGASSVLATYTPHTQGGFYRLSLQSKPAVSAPSPGWRKIPPRRHQVPSEPNNRQTNCQRNWHGNGNNRRRSPGDTDTHSRESRFKVPPQRASRVRRRAPCFTDSPCCAPPAREARCPGVHRAGWPALESGAVAFTAKLHETNSACPCGACVSCPLLLLRWRETIRPAALMLLPQIN